MHDADVLLLRLLVPPRPAAHYLQKHRRARRLAVLVGSQLREQQDKVVRKGGAKRHRSGPRVGSRLSARTASSPPPWWQARTIAPSARVPRPISCRPSSPASCPVAPTARPYKDLLGRQYIYMMNPESRRGSRPRTFVYRQERMGFPTQILGFETFLYMYCQTRSNLYAIPVLGGTCTA